MDTTSKLSVALSVLIILLIGFSIQFGSSNYETYERLERQRRQVIMLRNAYDHQKQASFDSMIFDSMIKDIDEQKDKLSEILAGDGLADSLNPAILDSVSNDNLVIKNLVQSVYQQRMLINQMMNRIEVLQDSVHSYSDTSRSLTYTIPRKVNPDTSSAANGTNEEQRGLISLADLVGLLSNGNVVKFMFSVLFFFPAIFVILSKRYDEDTRKWAFSILTLISGVWIGTL